MGGLYFGGGYFGEYAPTGDAGAPAIAALADTRVACYADDTLVAPLSDHVLVRVPNDDGVPTT